MENNKHDHVSISGEELERISADLERDHETYLESYGVTMPKEGTQKHLWLIYLKKFQRQLVHKDTVSSFVQEHMPGAGKDQQVRHLAADGWWVLNKGDKLPDVDEKVKPGFHMLVTTESPKPTFIHKVLKRIGRIGARDWAELKAAYDFRCVNCGSQEGKPHRFEKNKATVLHQGHMNPDLGLELTNVIPQCESCNTFYKDSLVFDDQGRVIAIASVVPLHKASEAVKKQAYEFLRRELESSE